MQIFSSFVSPGSSKAAATTRDFIKGLFVVGISIWLLLPIIAIVGLSASGQRPTSQRIFNVILARSLSGGVQSTTSNKAIGPVTIIEYGPDLKTVLQQTQSDSNGDFSLPNADSSQVHILVFTADGYARLQLNVRIWPHARPVQAMLVKESK